jgi:hypothetical protein
VNEFFTKKKVNELIMSLRDKCFSQKYGPKLNADRLRKKKLTKLRKKISEVAELEIVPNTWENS